MEQKKIGSSLHSLLLQGKKYDLPKGTTIQTTEGLKVFSYVKSGFVKRFLIANDGTTKIQIIYGPGDVFPLTLAYKSLLKQDIYDGNEVYYYETMTPAQIYRVEDSVLVQQTKMDQQLYKDLLFEAGRRLHSTLYSLENLTLQNTYNRVAHQLVYFAREYGEIKSNGIKITLPLTHQDLASILSVTRETISNSMVQLKKKGLIKVNKFIYVPNIKKLESEAYN